MTALGRPHLISQVLPSPFSISERGAKPWPDEGTAITVALATFNCFASVKMALFLFFFVPHLSHSLALIHSIPFLPITTNPPARTTIMRLHLQHGPHFPLAEGTGTGSMQLRCFVATVEANGSFAIQHFQKDTETGFVLCTFWYDGYCNNLF